MTINPADCNPDDVYLVRYGGSEFVAQRVDPDDSDTWAFLGPMGGRMWGADVDVTVLHRLVPERPADITVSVRSEADELDCLADEIEQITDDVDAPVSAASLREMAAEHRADAEAQAAEDALVEKTAQAIYEKVTAYLECSAPWSEVKHVNRETWLIQARAALAIFREEADQ